MQVQPPEARLLWLQHPYVLPSTACAKQVNDAWQQACDPVHHIVCSSTALAGCATGLAAAERLLLSHFPLCSGFESKGCRSC